MDTAGNGEKTKLQMEKIADIAVKNHAAACPMRKEIDGMEEKLGELNNIAVTTQTDVSWLITLNKVGVGILVTIAVSVIMAVITLVINKGA